MKTFRSNLPLAIAAGAILLSAAPSAHAQRTLRVDTAGNPTTPLNLGSPNIAGTLPPAHLGTGTPSSTTVLRGDGTWAGTTPSGATIASTGSLLMGDGAGNAAGISSTSDLQRVAQARLQSAPSVATPPANVLAGITPSGGTLNGDGTLTVPANGAVHWTVPDTGLAYYLYAVATADLAPGALTLRASQSVSYDKTASTGILLPGVVRSVTVPLTSGYGTYSIDLANTTAAPLTVYNPVMCVTDPGLTLLASHADHTPVAPQPVADLDFSRFAASEDRTARYLSEKQTTVAADSVNGSNAHNGSLYMPTATLAQWQALDNAVGNGAVLGLYRGSLFRESLPLSTLGTTHGIAVQDVALGQPRNLPIVSALDPATNSAFVDNGDGTFSCTYTTADQLPASDNYGSTGSYTVEINTATEATMPIASRRRMIDAASAAAVAGSPASGSTPATTGLGTAFTEKLGDYQWRVTLHPSDSAAPGSGSYRYEVVSRLQPANWGVPGNAGDGALRGLMLVGGSSGYGSLSGPPGFVGDRLAILHATGHNAVINGGSLQRSVFYDTGDPVQYIMLAWYLYTPTGLRWNTDHCLFYANNGVNRPANFIISHSGGPAYDRGDIADCAFLGGRWSDGTLQGTGIDYVNVTSGTINRIYLQGVSAAFGGVMPPGVEIKNSVFRQVNSVPVGGPFHDNIVESESGGMANTSPGGWLFRNPGAVVNNNLFWVHGLNTGATNDNGAAAFSFYPGVSTGVSSGNIILLDPAPGQTQAVYNQGWPSNLSGVSIDYNLVICTAPRITTGGVSSTWADYRAAYPTLDAHSLFVDLSGDPRGVKAVFNDPANGDFRWAQTEVARRCAAYCAANGVGPATVTSRWPVVPTVDEAVRLLSDL